MTDNYSLVADFCGHPEFYDQGGNKGKAAYKQNGVFNSKKIGDRFKM